MRRLYLLCAVLALALGALTLYYRAEPDTFYGIADTKELTISSESAVEIKRIAAAPGQWVSPGDTLVELGNPELEMRLSQISHELDELRARMTAHASLTKAELLHLKAQQEVRVSEIRAEIQELDAQYELNKKLVSELRSLKPDSGEAGRSDADNPVLVKLRSLRKLLELAQDPSRINENRLANELSSSGDPLADQVRQREDELRILTEDRKRLVIRAQIGGLIGSVNFKTGEKVSPFAPILTLHAAAPSFVRGYIHEDVYSRVAAGRKVRVLGRQDRRSVEGVVTGVGTRIVEYPERLRRRPDIRIWGREIIVRLPPDNNFLLGEKVLISLEASPSAAAEAGGSASAAVASAGVPSGPRESPPGHSDPLPVAAAGFAGTEVPGLEPSGLLYLADLGRLLAVSDDTPGRRAEAYLLDSSYRVEKALPVAGLERMDDIESVAEGAGGSVYLLSSQSRTRKGKLPAARKLLAKAMRRGRELSLAGKLSLADSLEALAAREPGEAWAGWFRSALAEGSLDIEGLAWRAGDLFLGCKAPLRAGKAVVLRLAGADSLLAGKALGPGAVSLWREWDLRDARTGAACGISELLMLGDRTYVLSTGKAPGKGHAGSLWLSRSDAESPLAVRDFGGERPEGLAVDAGGDSLFVAFDNGGRGPSRIAKVERPL